MSSFRMVYTVCADERRIQMDRAAAINPNIVREESRELLATPAWWEAVQSGRIPTRIRFVSVTQIEPNFTKGFPTIYFVDSDGAKDACELFGPEDAYKPGAKLAIMEWRQTLYPGPAEISPRTIHDAWFVFEIWIASESGA